MRHQVLVSYSIRDVAIANAVCARLEMDGIPCWLANRDLKANILDNAAAVKEYQAVIIACQIVVLILSQNKDCRLPRHA